MADSLATLLGSDPAAFPRPMVILHHFLPDGASHFDWLIARDVEASQPLMTFRLSLSPLALEPGQRLSMTQLPHHRPLYLEYEGPISNNRGTVRRIARGLLLGIQNAGPKAHAWLELSVNWMEESGVSAAPTGRHCTLSLRHERDHEWTLCVLAEDLSANDCSSDLVARYLDRPLV